MTPAQILTKQGACPEAIAWIGRRRSAKAAWDACERGDWLLWLVARLDVKREIVVFAACQCARLALKYTKDPCVLECIEITEAWTRGERMIEDVHKTLHAAAYAAYAAATAATATAADAAYAAATATAAYAAAYAAATATAAYAAYATATAAYAAATATATDADADAAYAAYAAATATATAARKETQKECARLVRRHIPWKLVKKQLKGLK